MLKTLDLQGCGFSDALSVRVVEPVLSGFVLCLACTAFQFFGTLPLFALPLLLLLACVSVSIRWVNSLSRLVGVASGGFSRGWRHGRIGHQSYVASIDDAKLGSGCDEFCV